MSTKEMLGVIIFLLWMIMIGVMGISWHNATVKQSPDLMTKEQYCKKYGHQYVNVNFDDRVCKVCGKKEKSE